MVVTENLGTFHPRVYRKCFCQENEIDRIFDMYYIHMYLMYSRRFLHRKEYVHRKLREKKTTINYK